MRTATGWLPLSDRRSDPPLSPPPRIRHWTEELGKEWGGGGGSVQILCLGECKADGNV